jgi:leucyl-tRNA synthetase
MRYDPKSIEPKWQRIWEDRRCFELPNDLELLSKKPKYYVLDMFPYPSGAGLHVGHPEGYTATDVVARMKRMQGFNVLHPMGWDAFGLPAERAAVRENLHPALITKRNTDNFRRQIKRLGFSYDWGREVNTTDASYYRWTQWIFLRLYERGLAYLAEVPVNWCPALGTVLANEEVKDGRYVETGDLVEKRVMRQWMLKITEYAERLLEDLESLDWPENVKEMQRNWIGKSEGAEVRFDVAGTDKSIVVFTTRHDTLFGSTFMVLAPEHPLVMQICSPDRAAEVQNYISKVATKSEAERTDALKEKTGVFIGAHAVNPFNQEPIPIWIADYVLLNYGTGAVVGVPGGDERDFVFANKFGLPIRAVVEGYLQALQNGEPLHEGKLIGSSFLNGMSVAQAKQAMWDYMEAHQFGRKTTQYRLRDWLFSRQRYWGEPFPIVYGSDGEPRPLSDTLLPIELPPLDEFTPTKDGRAPLARASSDWLHVKMPDGEMATREVNTMPQWAGSCWYYLRYLDPHNSEALVDPKLEHYFMPVDLYVGGVEHAVLHLLYARFWHKVLYDCGIVHTKEPFQKLFNQGMILAQSYQDDQGKYYYPEEVEAKGAMYFAKSTGKAVKTQIEKMSKSRYNVINPDTVIDEYGADAMRLYELFMGPLEQVKVWQMTGVEGVYRFLQRTWRLVVDPQTGQLPPNVTKQEGPEHEELKRTLHKTIKKVAEDSEELKFNTAISQMMIFVNEATAASSVPIDFVKTFLRVLSPYAPHLSEELWQRLGEEDLLAHGIWPQFDPALCKENAVHIVVQINGKKRDEIIVERGSSREHLETAALNSEIIQRFLGGQTPRKTVVVPERLVNFVL